jgi:hypothetical protein
VVRELPRVAFPDAIDPSDHEGCPSPARAIPPAARRAFSSVKATREWTTRRPTRTGKTTATVTMTVRISEYKFGSELDARGKPVDHLVRSTPITPLESFLASLPAETAAALRGALKSESSVSNKAIEPESGIIGREGICVDRIHHVVRHTRRRHLRRSAIRYRRVGGTDGTRPCATRPGRDLILEEKRGAGPTV